MALPDGVTLIDDCYNANPMSMRAALEDLALTAARADHAPPGRGARRHARARAARARLPRRARRAGARAGVDLLVTVGPLAAAVAERFDGELHAVPDAATAAQVVPELLRAGDVVLVKGSRGVGLELVCRALRDRAPASSANGDRAGA